MSAASLVLGESAGYAVLAVWETVGGATMIRHRVCGGVVGYRLRLSDDGDPVIVRLCDACDCAVNTDDCDPPTDFSLDDVPADLIAQLIHIGTKGTR